MKIVLKTVSLCLVILAVGTIAFAQNSTTKRPRPKASASTSRVICLDGKIPEGFIIAGYKLSASCGSKPELVVKRPADTEVVCAASPIPVGFRVVGLQGSPACATTDSNPLTNATLIERDSLVSTLRPHHGSSDTVARAPTDDDGDEDIPRRETRKDAGSRELSSDSQSASQNPRREDIEIAVRRSTVIIGMEMQDVSRAWGKSHTTDSLIEDNALTHIWGYRRGKVYFRNGIVYKILLLKG